MQLEFDELWRCSAAKAQVDAACTAARAEQQRRLVNLLAAPSAAEGGGGGGGAGGGAKKPTELKAGALTTGSSGALW